METLNKSDQMKHTASEIFVSKLIKVKWWGKGRHIEEDTSTILSLRFVLAATQVTHNLLLHNLLFLFLK